ncbi:hypothetical protein [Rivibacter subsaxonicus]|uniref:hypothetical protein n=1 Tax=Rivibacter subsaxonicus TaxID=457575 RepID=UPI001A91AE23|nr:hypothetical protein [Rivibacter subsaxonicus]
MHIRTSRASVAVDTPGESKPSSRPANPGRRPAAQTLWATRPLALRDGRAIAVRLVGDRLEVAVVDATTATIRWRLASSVLTERQATIWANTSDSRRTR